MSRDKKIYPQEPLAIIGIGCMFPRAGSLQEYWSNIKEGVDAITEIPATHWKPEDYFDPDQQAPDKTYARRGGFIDPVQFDPLLYGISPKNIEATDTTQLLGMVAAREALLDAGYATGRDSNDGRQFDRDRTSVILGVTGTLELVIPLGARLGHPLWRRALLDAGVDEATAAEVIKRIAEGYVPWQENSFPGLLGNVAAGRIANRFDLGGTNCVVDAACASSLSAIHLAAMELQAGRSDMAITGGVDTFNDIFMYMCFSKTPALSPTGNSRPFHVHGDGTILGEGIGVVILKRLADAERDQDRIYALIRGIGTSSDGKGNAIYAPSAAGQQKALRDAYRNAAVPPHTIELVEAHGTGTRVGDAVEAEALSGVYRADRQQGTWCAIGSVKSMIGHTKAAAGVAGLIKVVMALRHKVLPPTIKVDQPLEILKPGAAPVYVNTIKRPWPASPDHPRRAAVSAFGFGGSNFHAVLEEADTAQREIDWSGRTLIFAYAGENQQSLLQQLAEVETDTGNWRQLRKRAALSLKEYDGGQEHRLLLVIDSDRTDINKLLQSARSLLADPKQNNFLSTPDGVFYGKGGATAGGLAFLFPGQGAQYPGMLRDLACQFPQLLSALEEADTTLGRDEGDCRLSDRIYPIPVFDEEAREQQKLALTATATAQPAIGAVSNGTVRILGYFGIRADACAGHSFGELTALNYAGWFSTADLFRLAHKRGLLMQAGDGDRGAMLAVISTPDELYRIIEERQLDLIIANHNAPAQLVLSGATAQIEKAEAVLSAANIRTSRLPVAAAFHSSFVAGAEKPLADFIDHIEFTTGRIPVYSNTTAETYADNPEQARALLAGQLAQPVEFVREIENMYAAGIRTFVEVGPSNIITGMVNKILADRDHHALAVDASKGKRPGQYDLALALARMAALGYHCDLKRWDAVYLDRLREEPPPVMAIPLSGANYVMPRERSKTVTRQVETKHNEASETSATVPQPSAAVPQASPASADQAGNGVALQAIQQGILALQKLQEQTAQLHRQYLEGQENAQRTIQQLLQQQQQLISGVQVTPIAPAITPVPSPPPADAVAGRFDAPAAQVNAQAVAMETPQPVKKQSNYQNILLEVVAEKTGYPVDMLSLDMSLDTDLGIDSIKRVEILSALQERLPGMQKVDPEDLGTFQLLQHIVEYLAGVNLEAGASVESGDKVHADTAIFQQVLVDVVAEKTGYPADMLNLDMHLDSDLGIDSIKRVEILSALQERLPDAPTVKPEELGQLHTLRQIVDFMGAGGNQPTPASVPVAAVAGDLFQHTLLEVVADKTGYPADMLNLDMHLDSDLGIDSIKRVEILSALQERLPGAPAVKPEELGQLHTLRQIVDYMQRETGASGQQQATQAATIAPTVTEGDIYRCIVERVPLPADRTVIGLPEQSRILVTDDGTDLPIRICTALAGKKLQAEVINLSASISEDDIAGLLVLVPERVDYSYIENVFSLVQQAGRCGIKLLSGITRLGGGFGFRDLSTADPEAAAVHGIIKTAFREWPEASCKVIDISDVRGGTKLAAAIVDELLMNGPLEVGIRNTDKYTLSLQSRKVARQNIPENPCPPGAVIVVTGGARGITAETALALARTYGCNLLLLGRSPEPEPEPDWLAGLATEADIKQAIISRQTADQAPAPKAVETEFRRFLANREIRGNLERIRATGVTVVYKSVDVRDTQQVSAAIDAVRREVGPICGIVHGAGVLADRYIADKTPEQFKLVYSTKVAGMHSLLAATEQDDLKIMVMFSSSTARFGRKGQADYAAANEVLNKIAQGQQQQRPDCRVLSVNWGPWSGGMVTPQLAQVFAAEGVGLIPVPAGADYLMQEITNPGPVEIVVLGSEPSAPVAAAKPDSYFNRDMQLAFERDLSVENFPVLKSHIMNGRAVLPAALIMEWLAHGAMHNNPGLSFIGIDDFRILKGVTLDNGETATLQIMAGPVRISGNRDTVPVELRSGDRLHARAVIVLSADYENPFPSNTPVPAGDYPYQNGEYYRNGELFHGADLHGIQTITGCSDRGIVGTAANAPPPGAWSRNPIRSTWLADPLVLDACFQLMILWSFRNSKAGSLPTAIRSYRQYQRAYPKDGVEIVARIVTASGHGATADIEIKDHAGILIARLDGYECVIDSSLNDAFRKNQYAGILE